MVAATTVEAAVTCRSEDRCRILWATHTHTHALTRVVWVVPGSAPGVCIWLLTAGTTTTTIMTDWGQIWVTATGPHRSPAYRCGGLTVLGMLCRFEQQSTRVTVWVCGSGNQCNVMMLSQDGMTGALISPNSLWYCSSVMMRKWDMNLAVSAQFLEWWDWRNSADKRSKGEICPRTECLLDLLLWL